MITFYLAKLKFSQMVIFYLAKLNFPQIVTFWEHEIIKHKRESTSVKIAQQN